jgi:SAM-dependent methyltransferase
MKNERHPHLPPEKHPGSASLRSRLRKLFDGLKKTPVHPQWLVARDSEHRCAVLCRQLRGIVLDVGSGDRQLEKHLPAGTRYIGLDYPPSGTRYRARPHVWADAMQLPIRAGSVDGVALFEVLEHLTAPGLALKEAARVLRNGGAVVLTVPFLYPIHDAPFDFSRLTASQLRHLAAEAGLDVVELNERGHALETAAMLACLSLAEACIRAVEQRRLMALFLPPFLLAVPVVNIAGYLLSRLFPVNHFMPAGYDAILEKI